jgi:hypothetical protein
MTKRIVIALSAAVAFLFVGAAGQAGASVLPNGGVHTDGCPTPLVLHPDGTCWP